MVVRLRNGTHHEEVSKKMKELIVQVAHKREETDGAKEKEMEIPNRDKVPEAPKHFKVLFPERLQKTKLVAQFQKFLEVFKNLHIKIPFADAELFKYIVSKKWKLVEGEMVALTQECSLIIQMLS